jgi:hypothetical protein
MKGRSGLGGKLAAPILIALLLAGCTSSPIPPSTTPTPDAASKQAIPQETIFLQGMIGVACNTPSCGDAMHPYTWSAPLQTWNDSAMTGNLRWETRDIASVQLTIQAGSDTYTNTSTKPFNFTWRSDKLLGGTPVLTVTAMPAASTHGSNNDGIAYFFFTARTGDPDHLAPRGTAGVLRFSYEDEIQGVACHVLTICHSSGELEFPACAFSTLRATAKSVSDGGRVQLELTLRNATMTDQEQSAHVVRGGPGTSLDWNVSAFQGKLLGLLVSVPSGTLNQDRSFVAVQLEGMASFIRDGSGNPLIC